MLFDLPYSTFDQARARDLAAQLYCPGCHRNVDIDINDERLSGKSFCSGVRFRCTNFLKLWTASPGHVCNQLASISLRPRVRIDPNDTVPYVYIYCCRPGWRLDQVRGDDPEWHYILTYPRFGLRCPTCRKKAQHQWVHMTGKHCMDELRAAGPAAARTT